jgi:hypothetical protein
LGFSVFSPVCGLERPSLAEVVCYDKLLIEESHSQKYCLLKGYSAKLMLGNQNMEYSVATANSFIGKRVIVKLALY